MKKQLVVSFIVILFGSFLARSEDALPQLSDPFQSSGPRNYVISGRSYEPLDVDINEDGITDISFDSSFMITGDVPTSGGSGTITINTLDNYVLSDGRYALPSSTLGADAAQDEVWKKGSFIISTYSVNFAENTFSGWNGPWSDVDIAYLIVLFKDSGNQLHKASIRLLVPDDGSENIYIMDWSYGINPIPDPTTAETTVLSSDNSLQLSFSSVHSGLEYVLEHSTNLVDGAWTTNSTFTANTDSISVTNAITSQSGYFRLRRK